MKCLIMSGGVKPKDEIIKQYADFCDLIIGVDKGCNYLYDLDIKPNYIVGDFDSSNIEVIEALEKRGSVKYKYKCEKDFTDSEEAFELAISSEVTEIYFLGATGQRFDHTLGNSNTSIKNEKEYKYISFLAYNETIREFSIKKAKYELNKYNLEVGDSRTVSNEFISDEIEIELSNGNILIIFSKD